MLRPFAKKYCNGLRFRAFSGCETNPVIFTNDVSVLTGISWRSSDLPKRSTTRCLSEPGSNWCRVTSLCTSRNSLSGLTSARRSNSCTICVSSTESFLRNLRRAGKLKNRFFTDRFVPAGQASASWLSNFDAAICRWVPMVSPRRIVRRSICATAAIEGRASPRNPIVWRSNRSAACLIFEVA